MVGESFFMVPTTKFKHVELVGNYTYRCNTLRYIPDFIGVPELKALVLKLGRR